jgi:hypothetical protein
MYNSCIRNIVVGKSVSHHHHHSAWQKTELWQEYRGTGMMEMDRVTGADGDIGVTEMDRATGCRDPGDSGVERLITFHIIVTGVLSHISINHLLT